MTREVVRPLLSLDEVDYSMVKLEPGSVLSCCQLKNIRSGTLGGRDPYVVAFEWSGRRLVCPLFQFQPRTRVIEVSAVCAPGAS